MGRRLRAKRENVLEHARATRRSLHAGTASDLSYEARYHLSRIAALDTATVEALETEEAPQHVWRWVAMAARPAERKIRCALMVAIRHRVDFGADRWPIDREKTAALAAFLRAREEATAGIDLARVAQASRSGRPWDLIPAPEDIDPAIYARAMAEARARPGPRRARTLRDRSSAAGPLLTAREVRVLEAVLAKVKGSAPA